MHAPRTLIDDLDAVRLFRMSAHSVATSSMGIRAVQHPQMPSLAALPTLSLKLRLLCLRLSPLRLLLPLRPL